MHPILLKIGPIELYTYGAFLAVAFLTAIYLATREAERVGLKSDFVADLGIILILSSIVGARLFYILFYDLQYTLEHPTELLRLRQTGLVFYGGLFSGFCAIYVFCRLKRAPFLLVIDTAAPSIAMGQAIGRIGCFMSGCCYGKPTWVFWAVKFPQLDQLRHPTQIYESAATFIVFLLLMRFRKHKSRDGQTIWLYAVMYASLRFGLEFLRGDNPQVLMGLTLSQVIGVLVLIAAVPLGFLVWMPSPRKQSRAEAARSSEQ